MPPQSLEALPNLKDMMIRLDWLDLKKWYDWLSVETRTSYYAKLNEPLGIKLYKDILMGRVASQARHSLGKAIPMLLKIWYHDYCPFPVGNDCVNGESDLPKTFQGFPRKEPVRIHSVAKERLNRWLGLGSGDISRQQGDASYYTPIPLRDWMDSNFDSSPCNIEPLYCL